MPCYTINGFLCWTYLARLPDTKVHPQARLQAAGWSRQEVINAPNTLCMLRALSGPCVVRAHPWNLCEQQRKAAAVGGAALRSSCCGHNVWLRQQL